MLVVFVAALMGQPAGYALPESVLQSEPLYQTCMQRHQGSSRQSKCGCIVTYLTMNGGDASQIGVAFELLFQYYQPAYWEIQDKYGVDQKGAYAAQQLKFGADNTCQFSPNGPNEPLRD